MTSAVYHMELLSRGHERAAFHCGEDALDRYLKEQASQDMKRHCSTVVVAVRPDLKAVLGFNTISSAIIKLDDLPDPERKRLPRYEHIPAVLLGRLAVSEQEKGQGLGSLLLADAVTRACRSDIAWAVLDRISRRSHYSKTDINNGERLARSAANYARDIVVIVCNYFMPGSRFLVVTSGLMSRRSAWEGG